MSELGDAGNADHQESPDPGVPDVLFGMTIDGWLRREPELAIELDSCAPFERIEVKTHGNVYEVIVIDGRAGEVLVRGGRFFPELRSAILTGSTAGGSILKLRSLEVGLSMEFLTDNRFVITSAVEALSRADRRQNHGGEDRVYAVEGRSE